ncbi:MAG: tetratricopeptide repeat protein, partial [Phycisphaerales bacterium]
VIELAPEDSRGHRELGWLYLSAKKSFGKARELAERAVKLEKTADNYYLLACACEMSGDKTDALAAAGQAVRLDPSNAEYKRTYQRIGSRK